MSEFDDEAFDEGLRRVVAGHGVDPPPSAWTGVRLAMLERQLTTYKSTTIWLKGTVGVLSALLGVVGYLLYQSSIPPIQNPENQVAQASPDTVYLTRTETVYRDRPVVVYLERPEVKNKYSNTELNPTLSDQHSTSNTWQAESKAESSNTVVQNGTDVQNKAESSKNLKSNNSKPVMKAGTSGDNSRNLFDTDESNRKQSSVQNLGTENTQLDDPGKINASSELALLKPISTSFGRNFKMPKPRYRGLFAPVPDITKLRTPLSERISLSAYVSPDWNKIDVRREEPDAFTYGDEELLIGVVAGLRASVKLSKKWTVVGGVEFGGSSFDDGNRRVVLSTETINGETGYQYRSALGTVAIPSKLLSSVPRPSDAIGLEIHEPILRYSLSLPLSFRYELWQKHYLFLGQVPMNLQIYGIFGGYWQVPLRQEGKVQIYESSGREFTAELRHFQNLRSSWGIQAGVGTELGIGRHFNFFIEPTVSRGLTSVVENMSLTTTLSNFGVKVGTRWSFEKR